MPCRAPHVLPELSGMVGSTFTVGLGHRTCLLRARMPLPGQVPACPIFSLTRAVLARVGEGTGTIGSDLCGYGPLNKGGEGEDGTTAKPSLLSRCVPHGPLRTSATPCDYRDIRASSTPMS